MPKFDVMFTLIPALGQTYRLNLEWLPEMEYF